MDLGFRRSFRIPRLRSKGDYNSNGRLGGFTEREEKWQVVEGSHSHGPEAP